MGVSENVVYTPKNPMVLLIIIPMKNGYFIGNINPRFSDTPRWQFLRVIKSSLTRRGKGGDRLPSDASELSGHRHHGWGNPWEIHGKSIVLGALPTMAWEVFNSNRITYRWISSQPRIMFKSYAYDVCIICNVNPGLINL